MNHPFNQPFSGVFSDFPTRGPTAVRPEDARGTDAMVMGLWRSLALRDEATAMHSLRVAQWVVLLADECGLPSEERWSLRRGALLHDIGKLGVPDAVLYKPGALDEAERALVNSHPESGYALLRAVEPLHGIAPLVRHHHERWDGKGYPGGLAGEEIPHGARLLAVCDTFDAMTSNRPYRQGLAREVALQEIARAAGSQLDPEATRAFLRIARW